MTNKPIDLTDDQRKAIEKLQSDHGKGATSDDRKKFMHAIANVPKEELETVSAPKEKRGRKPKSA